jgi:Ca-activated chloride channel family protein
LGQDESNAITLTFTYGSEKQAWLSDVTRDFNSRGMTIRDGRRIVVEAIPMGSGECMRTLLEDDDLRPHLTSPASEIFIRLTNAKIEEDEPLVGPTRSLVVSPVVIAMWKKMAQAIGWGIRPVGWQDVLDLVNEPEGWGAYDFPQWGRLKFGHTHPETSNSGLLSLVAIVYAGAGKTEGLTIEDVARPETRDFLRSIESSVVHYGSSTGFFGRKMFAYGPENLSCAVLYENMVIESYNPEHGLAEPIVALYPKEGTFWSDHPVGVVNRPWVSPAHREASRKYIEFLLDEPQQERAMQYGFRPGDVTIKLRSPIDAAHGVDPKQPQRLLEVPSRKVVEAILDTWRSDKKHARLVLVVDVSGSMRIENRLQAAQEAAVKVLDMLSGNDRLSLLVFSSECTWISRDVATDGAGKKQTIEQIQGLNAFGKTSLFDATYEAYKHLQKGDAAENVIRAIVLLSDGADTASDLDFNLLSKRIVFDPDKKPVLIFTIGYGNEAQEEVLEDLARKTQAKYYRGDPGNIREILTDSAYFYGSESSKP